MDKEELQEIRAALQRLMIDMEDVRVRLERLQVVADAEDAIEEERHLASLSAPPPPSPNFMPMQTRAAASARRAATPPRLEAPTPINHSGWLATLADLASVSPKNKMGQ